MFFSFKAIWKLSYISVYNNKPHKNVNCWSEVNFTFGRIKTKTGLRNVHEGTAEWDKNHLKDFWWQKFHNFVDFWPGKFPPRSNKLMLCKSFTKLQTHPTHQPTHPTQFAHTLWLLTVSGLVRNRHPRKAHTITHSWKNNTCQTVTHPGTNAPYCCLTSTLIIIFVVMYMILQYRQKKY